MLLAAVLGLSTLNALAAPKSNKSGSAKGQEQMKGGEGAFGAIYTTKDDFNLQLISAQYSLEPHNDYAGTMPSEEEKLVVITYAIKNSRSSETRPTDLRAPKGGQSQIAGLWRR